MKKQFLFFLFALINTVLISQNTQYFNKKIFPYSGGNSLFSIVEMDSTYYILGGNVDTPSTWYQRNFIVNIDKTGNIVNKKIWWDSLHSYSRAPNNSLIKTNEQYLVYVGDIKDTLGKISGYMVKLNKNLDTIWTRIFTHPDTLIASQTGANVNNVFRAIKQCWDGGYIIAGSYNKDCIAGNVRSYLLKTDSLGNMEWIKTYPNLQYSYDVEITIDSGFVFTDFQNGFHINKTNQSGDIIWREIPNNEMHLISGSVEVLSDGSYVIMAPYVYSHPFPNIYLYGANIIKYNNSGQLIWDKKYNLFQSFKCSSLHQSFNLELLPDDNIIVSGTSKVVNPLDSNENGFKGVIMKLDQNGDSLWARYYGYGDFEDICQSNDIVLTDDGGFLGVGKHIHFVTGITYANAWIVKLDSMGCDTPGCHTVGIEKAKVESKKAKVWVYPNPASDEINIEFKGFTKGETINIVIYNSVGLLIKQVKTAKNINTKTINIKDFSPGIYYYQITSNSKSYSGKFVKM